MQVARDKNVLGDFRNRRLEHFGRVTHLKRRDERFVVRTEDGSGKRRDYEVTHAFGVAPLQQYLVRTEGGRLQALPVAWDSRPRKVGGQRWFHLMPDDPVPPGDALHWAGPAFNWNARCADCHATDVKRGFQRASGRYQTTMREPDVSCEACHGPASLHVAWASAEARHGNAGTARTSAKGLVHPLTKPKARRWAFAEGAPIASLKGGQARDPEPEVCAPCHSRRDDLGTGKGTRYHDRYRLELLAEPLYFPDGQIKSEVYVYGSFIQSRMWRHGVVCSDCHEPHSLEPLAKGNALCARCHRPSVFDTPSHHFHPPQSAGATCVGCHMPERTYMVVDPRRDHRLGVPAPELSAKIGAPDPCISCHADRSPAWAGAQIARHHERRAPNPHALALHKAQTEQPGADRALLASFQDRRASPMVRASALAHLRRLPPRALVRVVAQAAADDSPLVRRASLVAARVVLPAAGGSVRPLLADPVRSVRLEAAGLFRGADTRSWPRAAREHLASALREYRKSRLFSIDSAGSLLDLAYLEQSEARPQAAEQLLREALTRDPTYTPAYINLADLFRARGDHAACEKLLRQGLKKAASKPALHHALGLALVRAKRMEEALTHLKASYALQPEDAHAGYVYAVALFDTGKRRHAYRVLEQLHGRFAANLEVLSALVSYARTLGQTADAQRYRAKLWALQR